jgi:hypothetical protein
MVFERLEVAKTPLKECTMKPQAPSKNSKGKGKASRKAPQWDSTDEFWDAISSDENIPSVIVTHLRSPVAKGKGTGLGKGRAKPQSLVVDSVDEISDAPTSDKTFPSEIVSHVLTYE